MKNIRLYLLLFVLLYISSKCVFPKEAIQENNSPKVSTTKTTAGLSCVSKNFNFEEFLYRDVAQKIEGQHLLYNGRNPSKLQDCSGIFHRVLEKIAAKIEPNCSQYIFPSLQNRSSKSLARWYHEHDNLTLIGNPQQAGDLIKIGTVVFYGQQGKRYKKPTISLLTSREGVQHIGLVVEVERDAKGKLLNYGLFHGHGKTGVQAADITYFHRWKDSHLAYGNGSQQIVGVANVLTKE